MTPDTSALIRDPLFQLNSVLWLSQPVPTGHPIRPAFHTLGFAVYAIGPPLTLPLDLRARAEQSGIHLHPSVRPDVIVSRDSDRRFASVECKASSFSSESSNSEQLRTYLLIAGERAAESLGLAPTQVSKSILALITTESSQLPLNRTANELSENLAANGLPPGPFSVLGFGINGNAIGLRPGPEAKTFFGFDEDFVSFIEIEKDTDPRPLYFIPYDPDLNMTSEEKEFGRRVLFERVLASVIAAIGRAEAPTKLTMRLSDLLNDACLGIFAKWENPSSRRHMLQLTRRLLRSFERAVRIDPTPFEFGEDGLSVTIADVAQKDRILDKLTHYSTEAVSREVPPPTLGDYETDPDSGRPAPGAEPKRLTDFLN